MDWSSIQGRVSFILLVLMALQAFVSGWQQHWFEAALSLAILASVLFGFWLTRRLKLYVPTGLQFVAVAMIFAWLFLGYVHNYFERFTWWDTALHCAASAMVSIAAFFLVHLFNKSKGFGGRTRPGLLALFTFVFGVAVGALWEIFEFSMDHLFGFSMQKPMLGDESGLTDTISDLIADTVGALTVSVYGYYHLKNQSRRSVLKRWVNAFIQGNPRLFGRTD